MTTTSASCASSVASKPACSRSPAMRSESWTFIWQPKVSIRYLRAMASRCGPRVGRQLSPFALSLSPLPCGRPGPSFKHLTRGAAETIGNYVPAQHPGELVDAPGLVEPADRRPGPPALDLFLDLEMGIRVGRNLRQVRDAEDLERRSERAQAAADDVRDTAADAGVDLVKDQPGRRGARRPRRPVNESEAARRRHRFDRQHHPRQLAAGDDPRQGPELFPRIRRKIELG